MANQNAVENAFATTTDSGQQGDVNDPTTAVAPNNAATIDDGVTTVQETAPDRDRDDRNRDDDDEETIPSPPPAQTELVASLTSTEQEGEKKEVPNGRPYEIVFIVRTTHGDAIQDISDRSKALIEGAEGAVDNVRVSEVRRFSYPIEKENEGSYVVVNARFKTTTVAELDRFFKLEEGVIRHMIVREDV